METRQPQPIRSIREKSWSESRKSDLAVFTVFLCYMVCVRVCVGSLTHRPSAGGRLWSQQWEDQRYWPQHSRTDACIAHYTCSSSLLHPSSLHTHKTISAHHMPAGSLESVIILWRQYRILPILMMCTTIYTSFLRSPLPRSWIKQTKFNQHRLLRMISLGAI